MANSIRYIGHTETHKCSHCPNTVYLPRTTRYVSRTEYVCVECMTNSPCPIDVYRAKAIEHYAPRVVLIAHSPGIHEVKVLDPIK